MSTTGQPLLGLSPQPLRHPARKWTRWPLSLSPRGPLLCISPTCSEPGRPACPDSLALDVHLGLAGRAQGLKSKGRRVKSRYFFLLTPSLPDCIRRPVAALHRARGSCQSALHPGCSPAAPSICLAGPGGRNSPAPGTDPSIVSFSNSAHTFVTSL